MNNNIKKSFRAGLFLATGIVAMNSCTDAWNEHYESGAKLDFDGSAMSAIEAKAPEFAKIVKAYGYDRELASDNVYTVWAPADGTFNVSDYIDANGNMIADSADVVKEFIKNHVARFAFPYNGNAQDISLANSKTSKMRDGMFGLTKMTQTNISCTNGVIHIIDKALPYSTNLFELIEKQYKSDADTLKAECSLYQFLYDPVVNKDTLIEEKSVSSDVDENGEKIWIDKFVMRNNTVLKNVDAKLYEEDSSFIAILPTTKAWRERRQFAESLLNFSPVEDTRSPGACDSLKNHYANMFAMTDLFYNQNANEHMSDSLKSTNYDISHNNKGNWINHVYYSKVPRYMPEDKELNDILSKCGEKIDCSNGFAYIVDEYPMSAYEQFFKRITVRGTNGSIDQTPDSKGNPAYTKNVNTNFREETKTVSVYKLETSTDEDSIIYHVNSLKKDVNYHYVDVQPANQSSNISVAFRIPNTLSGEYDMYLVTCPIWMNSQFLNPSDFLNPEEGLDLRPYRFYTYIIERNTTGKEAGVYPTSGTRISNPDGSGNYFVTEGIKYDAEGFPVVNDTTYLGSYKFENAYYGRNEEGVLIQFQSQVTSKLQSQYSREMLINCLILKPRKADSESVVVNPSTEAKATKNNNQTFITKKD